MLPLNSQFVLWKLACTDLDSVVTVVTVVGVTVVEGNHGGAKLLFKNLRSKNTLRVRGVDVLDRVLNVAANDVQRADGVAGIDKATGAIL